MNQVSFSVEFDPKEVARKKTLGDALQLCAELAGFSMDKTLQQELKVDKAQFSRWMGGTEGILWPKFVALMDICGNDAPLMWMLHQRGYDLSSIRKTENEYQKRIRELEEQNKHLIAAFRGA